MNRDEEKKNIIITIPKSVKWEDYEKELDVAKNGGILNYKVRSFPKVNVGAKCYVVYNGEIIGYHYISGMSEKEFTCTTTGKPWKGKFIERTGEFHKLNPPFPMKGFMGYRYTDDLEKQ